MYIDTNKLIRDLNDIFRKMEADRPPPREPVVIMYKVTKTVTCW